ncbi:MAG: MarR family transcriptional regulator [Actinobacteria bacterium]|nr:MarR family transcriptional regulator [Actinomycetota bacterium]MBU1492515.1 MarR family transcriptional regulator [Actinomycetota bacterium]
MRVELRTTPASEAWQAVMTAFTRVRRQLALEVEQEAGIPLDWYGILLMLSQAESGVMRPSEIADQIGLSRSATTRFVDRLEHEGLVERRECPSDGRGALVGLTAEGEKVFRRAGNVHLRGIDEHIGSHLTLDELADLKSLMTTLANRVEGTALSLIARVPTD